MRPFDELDRGIGHEHPVVGQRDLLVRPQALLRVGGGGRGIQDGKKVRQGFPVATVEGAGAGAGAEVIEGSGGIRLRLRPQRIGQRDEAIDGGVVGNVRRGPDLSGILL